MKTKSTISLFAMLAVFVVACLTPSVVGAQSNRGEEARAPAHERSETNQSDREEKEKKQQSEEHSSARSDDKLKKNCESRKDKIVSILHRRSERGTAQIGVFDKIADRTEDFYVQKAYELDNYEALLSAMSSAKNDAEDAVAATKSAADSFSCETADLKSAGAALKETLNAQNDAIKDYKTAVKNLIVAVKSAQNSSATNDSEASGQDQ
jgi:hypothetical protein